VNSSDLAKMGDKMLHQRHFMIVQVLSTLISCSKSKTCTS